MTESVHRQVREHYADAARAAQAGAGCCGAGDFGSELYGRADIETLPVAAVQASLGCGNPLLVAELEPGDRVLDLGSGGGIDVLLSARRVGPAGRAYGVDMTPEMLELARRNAAEAGATNVEFRRGVIEDLPFEDASVDVVISNCVINLSADKRAVLAEAFRVLVPGGRFGVSDVVAEDRLDPAERAERGSYVGCVAGALSQGEYLELLGEVGFEDAEVELHARGRRRHARRRDPRTATARRLVRAARERLATRDDRCRISDGGDGAKARRRVLRHTSGSDPGGSGCDAPPIPE